MWRSRYFHRWMVDGKTAKSDREREIFLQMAQIWLEAASRADASQTPRDPDGPARAA
jgi:hypothetical protein